MKISDKLFKRYSLVICYLFLIYIAISDHFNINKYIKFLGVLITCIANILLWTVYHLGNKSAKKKDLIELILGSLLMVAFIIWWYIKFLY